MEMNGDGRRKRTGTLWTASAHISLVMVGQVLSVAWDISCLGWIAGPAAICLISFTCYYTSRLLCDCYFVRGKRNHTYRDSVQSLLGEVNAKACAFIQHLILFGMAIEITVGASVSMIAIIYTNCFHKSDAENSCYILGNPYMIIFGAAEILLSQIPDIDQMWWVSMVSVVMFFIYSLIGLGLAIAQVAATGSSESSKGVIETQNIWMSFQALGEIALKYSFSEILIEIQDTIRLPPSEVPAPPSEVPPSEVPALPSEVPPSEVLAPPFVPEPPSEASPSPAPPSEAPALLGGVIETQNIRKSFQALGEIPLPYSSSEILIDIQDTIRSPPSEALPSEVPTSPSEVPAPPLEASPSRVLAPPSEVPALLGGVIETQNIRMSFQALGEIAPAYSSSEILMDIQDTIRSPPSEAPPSEVPASPSEVPASPSEASPSEVLAPPLEAPALLGGVIETQNIRMSFQAIGEIASAYSSSEILMDIQDTIRSPPSEAPPSEVPAPQLESLPSEVPASPSEVLAPPSEASPSEVPALPSEASALLRGVIETQYIRMSFQALGEIASAYSSSEILMDIQDTIRSPPSKAPPSEVPVSPSEAPPSEASALPSNAPVPPLEAPPSAPAPSSEARAPPSDADTMKKATFLSTVMLTTLFMLWGCVGYAALRDDTPTNLVSGFAFYRPFWLLGIANAALFISCVGAYQMYSQPIFAFFERLADDRWPRSEFIAKDREIPLPGLSQYKLNLFRLVWRTVFVILITVISMAFPLFNEVVKIITLGFWPLAVYFPVEMYIKQKTIEPWEPKWVRLKMLSMACLAISIMATMGSIAGLKDDLECYRPFKMIY